MCFSLAGERTPVWEEGERGTQAMVEVRRKEGRIAIESEAE
jgi:hypothetical protein